MGTEKDRSVRGKARAAGQVGLLFFVLGLLAGCGSTVGGMPVVGEPEQARTAPRVAAPIPNVYRATASRTGQPMSAQERAKVEAELVNARDHAAETRRRQIQE